MYKIRFIKYYQSPTCFDPLCEHHQGSFTVLLSTQQVAELYQWDH